MSAKNRTNEVIWEWGGTEFSIIPLKTRRESHQEFIYYIFIFFDDIEQFWAEIIAVFIILGKFWYAGDTKISFKRFFFVVVGIYGFIMLC